MSNEKGQDLNLGPSGPAMVGGGELDLIEVWWEPQRENLSFISHLLNTWYKAQQL